MEIRVQMLVNTNVTEVLAWYYRDNSSALKESEQTHILLLAASIFPAPTMFSLYGKLLSILSS